MATNYPGALDDGTSLPTKSTGDDITSAETNTQSAAVKALEAKLGVGASTPAANQVPVGSAAGVSGWATLDHNAQLASLTAGDPHTQYSRKSQNLADLASIATALINLGLVIGTNVEAWDADLDAFAALDATGGLLAKTGAAAYARRSLTAPAAGITISNASGGPGNPTFALANDLAALEGLSGTAQLPRRTAADTWDMIDYIEGTWTPALAFGTPGTSSWAVTTQAGFYTKIGNRVLFNFFYQGVPTNGTAVGTLNLTGLPFTSNGAAASGGRFAALLQGYTKANFTQVIGSVQASSTIANFRASGSGQTTATLAVADIPSGGTVIAEGAGYYFV